MDKYTLQPSNAQHPTNRYTIAFLVKPLKLFVYLVVFQLGSGAMCYRPHRTTMTTPNGVVIFALMSARMLGIVSGNPDTIAASTHDPARMLGIASGNPDTIAASTRDPARKLGIASGNPDTIAASALDPAHSDRNGPMLELPKAFQGVKGSMPKAFVQHVYTTPQLAAASLALFAGAMVLGLMIPAGGGGHGERRASNRDPPYWSPDMESRYPFRYWMQDLLAWSMLASDMEPHQQAAAILLRLGGPARDLLRNMSGDEMRNGAMVQGQHLDPVTLIITTLATNFAPMGEESRLEAIRELFQFCRQSGESIDALCTRFQSIRHRASMGGTGAQMSWECYSWLLLQACGVDQQQLVQVLHPYQGRFPNTEPEFNAMQLTLRRMGHILENRPNNIASQLRGGRSRDHRDHRRSTFTGMEIGSTRDNPTWRAEEIVEDNGDPWHTTGSDPWAASSAAASAFPAAASTYPQDAYLSDPNVDSGTDTDTISDHGVFDMDDPELQGMTQPEIDEHIFWQYQRAKTQWRRLTNKPTRRVRRFVKRTGKGKGRKGKGKRRFTFLTEMSDEEYSQIFFGGKGKKGYGKGKHRSSGKGKGRRRNPIGRDGQVMKCGICDSEEHFRAECPQRNNQSSSEMATFTGTASATGGPLSHVLSATILMTHGQTTPAVREEQTQPAIEVIPIHTPSASPSSSWVVPSTASPTISWTMPPFQPEILPPAPDLDPAPLTVETLQVHQQQLSAKAVMPTYTTPPSQGLLSTRPSHKAPPLAPPPPPPAKAFPRSPWATYEPPPPLPPVTAVPKSPWATHEPVPIPVKAPPMPNPVTPMEPPLPSPFMAAVSKAPMAPPANGPAPYTTVVPPQHEPPPVATSVPAPPGTSWDQLVVQATTLHETAVPKATAVLTETPVSDPSHAYPHLQAFRDLAMSRAERLRRVTTGPAANNSLQAILERFSENSGPMQEWSPVEASAQSAFATQLHEFYSIQEANSQQATVNRQRRNCRAHLQYLAAREQRARISQPITAHAAEEPCAICTENLRDGDIVAIYPCEHKYHATCSDAWFAAGIQNGQSTRCPQCRGSTDPMQYAQLVVPPPPPPGPKPPPPQPSTPYDTPPVPIGNPQANRSPDSVSTYDTAVESVFPSWPLEHTDTAFAYHSATQLPGKVSVIVDSGAWTNLIGSSLAEKLAMSAMQNGKKPAEAKMNPPLTVQGVGNGSQACSWEIHCPVAVSHSDGHTYEHSFKAPIVEGSGKSLPALLGLRSMEQQRAILDTGGKTLILPGPGEVEIVLPPGSVRIPLEKAPSGHLVMVIDNYAGLSAPKGGLPPRAVDLLTNTASDPVSGNTKTVYTERVPNNPPTQESSAARSSAARSSDS